MARARLPDPSSRSLHRVLNTPRAFLLGMLIFLALVGLIVASVIYAIYNNTIYFQMGFRVGIDAFTAAVLGGIGRMPGAVLGGVGRVAREVSPPGRRGGDLGGRGLTGAAAATEATPFAFVIAS